MRHSFNKQHGFTVVELLVIVVVAGILTPLVIGTLGDFYSANTASLKKTVQDTDTRGVLRSVEGELTNTTGFMPELTVASAPLGSGNNATDATKWAYRGNDNPVQADHRVFIATAYATDKAASDLTRMLVFTDMGSGGGCDPATSTPIQNALIYFVGRDPQINTQYNLYRRTIVNITGGTPCTPLPFQKQTCTVSAVSSNPSLCKATDATLLYNIKSFSVDYYTTATDTTPIANIYGAADQNAAILAAKSVRLTVQTNQKVEGSDNASTATIRLSRTN